MRSAERLVHRVVRRILVAGVKAVSPQWLRDVALLVVPFRLRKRLVPSAKPRVLFVGDCYYSFWFLSRGLRQLGWTAHTLRTDRSSSSQPFLHGADFGFHYKGMADRVSHWWFFIRGVARYDVFHFYGVGNIRLLHSDFDGILPGILPSSWEIRLLRLLGKRIVYSDVGCPDGVLQSSMLVLTGEVPCLTCRWREAPDVCSDARTHAWGKARNRLADVVIAQGAWHKDYNASPKLREVPQAFCLDPEYWHPELMVPSNYRLPFPEGTVILYHAVGNFALRSDLLSRKNLKSTHVYLTTIERLKAAGYPVEMAFFQNVPNTEVRFYQAQADVVIDMLTYGWYGANVREALMLGKPVVCYIRPEWLAEVDRQNPGFASELPIVSATPETVYEVLQDLIEHPDKRAEIGRRSREFAVKWLSPEAAASRMAPLYLEVCTRKRCARGR